DPAPAPDGLVLTGEVVDAAAVDRCDVMGYACDWADAPDGAMVDSFELLEELAAEMDPSTPLESIELVAQRLLDDGRAAEVLPDLEGYTGIAFRLPGSPLVFLDTPLAGMDVDTIEERVVAPTQLTAPPPTSIEPQGFRGRLPERYHPVGGPLSPRSAVIIEPYAAVDGRCTDISWEGLGQLLDLGSPIGVNDCRQDGDGVTEGAAIAAIFRSEPEHYTSVVHLRDDQATPVAIARAVASANSLHIATHGSSNCRNTVPTGDLATGLRPGDYDPSVCYSMIALGPLSAQDRAALRAGTLTAPAGATFSNERWWATGDFIAKAVPNDAIVFGSNCTSADGRLGASGLAGFVGWHGYAAIPSAVDAAIRFWTMMVVDGTEFDVAYATLQDEGLHRSRHTNARQAFAVDPTASLVAGGTNPRARDVVTARVDGADLGGQTLRVAGFPGDAVPEAFPADDQAITFELEGVQRGSESAVKIELLLDGVELVSDIVLARDGVVVDSGADWDSWMVTVNPGAVKIPATTPADYAPGATKNLEVRAYERENRYTADAGDVTLGVKLAAVGPLPIFEELAAGLPPGAIVGNELRVEFDTDGGPVVGSMRVSMVHETVGELGFWTVDLTGTYDPTTGAVAGDGAGTAQSTVGFVSASEQGTGPWQGTVDLAAATMTATLGMGGQTQPFNGQIVANS
ncbi:MAG: hypothetical protein WBP59_04710, partial [Ilumatobacteraceae bacterium]